MIVTTGKSVRVEAGYQLKWIFTRTAEAPGVVHVSIDRRDVGKGIIEFDLPANDEECLQFINAYRRAAMEDVGYRERKNE